MRPRKMPAEMSSRRKFLGASSKWGIASAWSVSLAGISSSVFSQSVLGQQLGETVNQASDQEALEPTATATDETTPEISKRLSYESPQTQLWRIGLILETPVSCTNVLATFAVPMAWPEQTVELIGKTIDPSVTKWEVRDLPGGARQVVVQMARVPAGSSVNALFEFKIDRSRILGPEETADLVIPTRPSRELRLFMGNSPYIDASHGRIKAASRELTQMEAENDWQRVEQIYDYVREKVEYVEGSLKNASEALTDGKGDCEEMTSLFVALCRNARIPARMVWIPDHCYPEFYLEDTQGEGYWFPCQAAGTRQFGKMDEYRPVLQKGDRFKVPEKKIPVRYVSEYFRCDKSGKSNPDPIFVRELLDGV